MITSITMKGVASFSHILPITVDTSKRVNLFYGINGTGKSTISQFLQDSKNPRYHDCSLGYDVGGPDDYEVLVYNEAFVERTFHEKDNLAGVFTLGKPNADAEKAIEIAEKNINALDTEYKSLTTEKNNINNELQTVRNEIQDRVFKVKQIHDKQTLDFCLIGSKTKEGCFNSAKNTPFQEVDYKFEELISEATELQNQDLTTKETLGKIGVDFNSIETHGIFSEIIIGTSDSYLSELIDKLANTDWVRNGKVYLENSGVKCPFCQQKLPDSFENELNKIFDKLYEEKLAILNGLLKSYQAGITTTRDFFIKAACSDDYVTRNKEFTQAKDTLLAVLNKNLGLIQKKIATPSGIVTLESTASILDELQKLIDSIDGEIKAFNSKIQNKKKSLDNIKLKFWKLVRHTYNDAIADFEKREKDLIAKISVKSTKLIKIENDIKAQMDVISDNRKLITNIEGAIKKINQQIGLLGLVGFRIEKESKQSNFYRLKRDNTDSDVYKTLSEGEKTLITFLYFLEMCEGSSNEDAPMNLGKRIVVIDDPVSSLSHNYIYEIANIIRSKFYDLSNELRINQLFIFTHSLYFFHELLKIDVYKKSVGLLHRVYKNQNTEICRLNDDEILNDYQAYWKIFKDSVAGNDNKIIIPNVMRNILEHYFSFIKQNDKLKSALSSLSDENYDFKPLYRYVNRGSHSDAINIHGFKEIDPTRFGEMFRLIFEKTGFLEHYNTMMGS